MRVDLGSQYTITTEHSASSYGMPVVLDADGCVLDMADAMRAVDDWMSQNDGLAIPEQRIAIDRLARACRRDGEGTP